jgi:uncharacterized protein YkwD
LFWEVIHFCTEVLMIAAVAIGLVLATTHAAGRSPSQEWMQARSDAVRAAAGLPPLPADAALDALAQAHAERMTGRSAIWHSNADCRPGVREIVAMTGTSDPFDNWRKSTVGHGQEILDGRRACGFGAARDANGWKYWVALYR